ncbi:phosphatase PAP2 family protein [Thermodesulfobacteriota bacterium]
MKSETKNGWILLAAISACLIMVTCLFVSQDLDISIQKHFFSPEKGWFLGEAQPWKFLYHYGTVPGLLLTLGALAYLILGIFKRNFQPYRRQMLLIVLTTIIGAGILVNAVLKPYWGRPRPRQVKEFSGQWDYRQPYQPGIPGKGQSFPCGHCTMGFLFVTLVFCWKRFRLLAVIGGAFGVVYGFLLGTARILQGAHYATDVIWSLGIILWVSVTLYYLVLPKLENIFETIKEWSTGKKYVVSLALVVLSIIITMVFLTRRPLYETYVHPIDLKPTLRKLIIGSNVDFEKKEVKFTKKAGGRLLFHAQGFGWTASSHTARIIEHIDGNTVRIVGIMLPKGYFSELNHHLDIYLPAFLEGKIEIEYLKR